MTPLTAAWARWDRNPGSADATNALEDIVRDRHLDREMMAMLRRAGWGYEAIEGVL